ncbi:hypothetical protein AGMMS50239_23160 [Bacteroidia bacterium]|nr:hypothetical protein AGMMS50239_23160 [Bacteroidia bacterium]
MYKAFYLNEVREDIKNAKQWYREQQEDLEEKFILSLKVTISNILKMPSAYAIRYKKVRIAHTKIFPYNIHFYIDDEKNQIIITGIIHNKRRDALRLDRNIK